MRATAKSEAAQSTRPRRVLINACVNGRGPVKRLAAYLWLICLLGLHSLWIADEIGLRKAHTEPFVLQANAFLAVIVCGVNAAVIE
jgi:hypothetical protein